MIIFSSFLQVFGSIGGSLKSLDRKKKKDKKKILGGEQKSISIHYSTLYIMLLESTLVEGKQDQSSKQRKVTRL